MNTITFDGGVKRQFALPAAIVVGAYAALFLGFGKNSPVIQPPGVLRPATPPAQQIDLTPPEGPVSTGDDQVHSRLAKSQPPDIPNPILPGPMDRPEITITSENHTPLPVTPVIGPWSPGDPSHAIGPGGRPVSLDLLDKLPRAVAQPQPIYPEDAKSTGQGGEVVVAFVVDESGRVLDPSVVSSSDPVFDEPTLRAIEHWRFAPGTMHGVPVRFRMSVPVAFHLDR